MAAYDFRQSYQGPLGPHLACVSRYTETRKEEDRLRGEGIRATGQTHRIPSARQATPAPRRARSSRPSPRCASTSRAIPRMSKARPIWNCSSSEPPNTLNAKAQPGIDEMAKSKIHYILVRATFKKPVTATQAIAEVRDLAALSYEEHYTSAFRDTVDTVFKLKTVKRLSQP